jgi:hypothetical protein
MPQSPWFVTSGLHAYYFSRRPEGTVFTLPPLWMFGQRREYPVSEAQEMQLAAHIRRAYAVCVASMLLALISAVVTIMSMMPSLFVDYPITASLALGFIALIPALIFASSLRRAVGSVLAGASSTSGGRGPRLKNVVDLILGWLGMLPTWALILLVVWDLADIVTSIIQAGVALSSGQLSKAMVSLLHMVVGGALLVCSWLALKARRSEQGQGVLPHR